MRNLKDLGLNLQIIDIGNLIRWEDNFNPHDDGQIDDLAGSVQRWKQYKNIVGKTQPDGRIKVYAGEGFWRGLERAGLTEIVVNVRDDLSDAEIVALGVQDNFSATQIEEFDFGKLKEITTGESWPSDVPGVDEVRLDEILALSSDNVEPLDLDGEPLSQEEEVGNIVTCPKCAFQFRGVL